MQRCDIMKKVSEPFPGGKYDSSEVSRRLYRGAVEAARRLEEQIRTTSQQDLLGPEVTALRMRLKDYCERLMFSDPVEYGKKAEELMWRKVYYDIIQVYKQQKKKIHGSQPDYSLQNCLLVGIGNYHHLLLRLQAEFQLDIEGKIEIPFLWHQKGIKKERWKRHQRSLEVEEGTKEWAEHTCHRFLICLGDLARYLADSGDTQSSFLSERYYRQAFCIDPTVGMPHNQLGTLVGMSCYGCEASYYYMRCLLSPQSFDGAEGNLQKVFEKNSETFKEIDTTDDEAPRSLFVRRFMARFLKVCEQLFNQKDDNIHLLCQDTLRDLDHCLAITKEELCENAKAVNKPATIDPELMFKLVIMSLMCVARLQIKSSPLISTAAAFTLTLFSHVIRHYVKDLKTLLYPQLKLSDVDQLDNNEDAPGTRNTSGTVTPTPTLKYLEQNDNNVNSFVNCVGKSSRRSQKKNKKHNKRRSASHLRTSRRRRNASSTSQEDSEMSEEELNDSDLEDKRLSDPGAANSDISETSSSSSGSQTEQEDELGDVTVTLEKSLSSHQLNMKNCIMEGSSIVACNGVLSNDEESGLENCINYNSKNCKNVDVISENDHKKHFWSVNNNFRNDRLECEEIKATVDDICHALSTGSFLPTIKIVCDWMRTNPDIITACAESSRPLWCRLTDLFNVLLKVETKLMGVEDSLLTKLKTLQRNGKAWQQPEPLAEDIEMREFSLLAQAQSHLHFDGRWASKLSSNEQAFLRLQCILRFGDALTGFSKTSVSWNSKSKLFEMGFPATPKKNPTGSPEHQETNAGDMESQRKQLMRNMAQLWLKSEVSDLEVLVENNGGMRHLSPYLVPDTSALCYYLPLLKQLESARRFIIIVPSIVISNLDHLKRESVGAREAIRWLENELRRGSRYLRAQKQQERLSLLPIKYPRKKDKEAWDFFQVLECSNYLNQQSSKSDSSAPLITLITGGNQILPANAAAIAQSAGIHMEPIEEFISKWRSSSKSQG